MLCWASSRHLSKFSPTHEVSDEKIAAQGPSAAGSCQPPASLGLRLRPARGSRGGLALCLCLAAAFTLAGRPSRAAPPALGSGSRMLPALPAEHAFEKWLAEHMPSPAPRPDTLLVIVDTLRADRVSAELMPTLRSWFDTKALHAARTWAAATSTDHSLFATFFMRPAFEREHLFAAGWRHGSPAMRVLAAAGYDINLFAFPNWYTCSGHQPPAFHFGPWSNLATLQLLYGQGGSLLHRCPSFAVDAADLGNLFLADRSLIDHYLQEASEADQPPARPPRFDIIHLYGMHSPYGVDRTANDLARPWLDGTAAWRPVPQRSRIPAAEQRLALRNTYDNAARSLDRNLRRLLAGCAALGPRAPQLVAIFSDHGEALPMREAEVSGHGMAPDAAQAEVVMGIADERLASLYLPGPTSASTMALFATLFDSLGLPLWAASDPIAAKWSSPLQRENCSCYLIVEPRQALPPDRFAISDGHYKVFVQSDHNRRAWPQQLLTVDDADVAHPTEKLEALAKMMKCLIHEPATASVQLLHCGSYTSH